MLVLKDIRIFVHKNPVILMLARKTTLVFWYLRFYLSRLHSRRVRKPLKIMRVHPLWIRYSATDQAVHPKHNTFGLILDGDWDKSREEIASLDSVKAIEEHFQRGTPWENTRFYSRVLREIREGQEKWGCRTQRDFDQRLSNLDGLYERLKVEGFKSQVELGTNKPWDEITVCIGRGGELMFVDGRHRLSMARSLGLREIPVNVSVRHEEWLAFSNEVRTIVKERRGVLPPLIPHPDFQDISDEQGQRQFEIMLNHLPIREGRVLELGTNWGYYCHHFEDAGFECVAYENSESNVRITTRFRDALGRTFRVEGGAITDLPMDRPYEVVLAFNLAHLFPEEDSFHRFETFLGRMRARSMFLESPSSKGNQQTPNACCPMSSVKLVRFIMEKAGFTKSEQIGIGRNDLPLYWLH